MGLSERIRTLVGAEIGKIGGNLSWLMADQIVRMVGNMLISIWIARYLGPAQFGVLGYAMALSCIGSFMSSLQVDRIVVRDIVQSAEHKDEILGSALLMKLSGGLASIAIVCAAATILRPGDHQVLLMVALISMGTVFQAFWTVDLWFQSQYRSKYTMVGKSLAFVVSASVKIGLILGGAPVEAFALALLIEGGVAAAALVVLYHRSGGNMLRWRFRRRRAVTMLSESWPLIFAGLAVEIQGRGDQILLGELIGPQAVGLYNSALKVVEHLGAVPMLLATSLAPFLAKAGLHGETSLRQGMLFTYRVYFVMFFLLAAPIYLLSDWIVLLMYGQQYAAAGPLLALLALRLFFTFFGVARSAFLLNSRMTWFSMVATVVGAVADIALALYMIPKYGVVGAIYASLLSMVVSFGLIDLLFARTRANMGLVVRAIATPWRLNSRHVQEIADRHRG